MGRQVGLQGQGQRRGLPRAQMRTVMQAFWIRCNRTVSESTRVAQLFTGDNVIPIKDRSVAGFVTRGAISVQSGAEPPRASGFATAVSAALQPGTRLDSLVRRYMAMESLL